MKDAKLKAIVLSNEISLNKISDHFGINKKFRWDETLILTSNRLKGIINDPEDKKVFVFSFGCAVFVNLEYHEISDIIKYLAKIEKTIDVSKKNYEDDYEMILSKEEPLSFNNDFIILKEIHPFHFEIISTVLAKSVALEKVEYEIDLLTDNLEELVDLLGKGDLNPKEKQVTKIWSQILRFKYNTISNLMLLDKPDITWNNVDAEKLYEKMSGFFELKHRYDIVKHKTDTLEDITQAFGSLTQTKKGNRLEWIIIILITFELLVGISGKLYDLIANLFFK
jgi:required for meiotic nuclear division protein 1